MEDTAVLNPRFVNDITSDKSETYKHFATYQPLSHTCTNSREFTLALDATPGEIIVIKSPKGSGGHKVRIIDRDKINPAEIRRQTYPLIVQEFLDTSVGIPGMVEGVHDLRIKIGAGEIWGGTLRTPRPGELRANVALGGTERHLFADQIPQSAKVIAHEIDKIFCDYPRYYSIDLANTPQGWKLIELNSKPGLSPIGMSPQSKSITQHISRYLVDLGNSLHNKVKESRFCPSH